MRTKNRSKNFAGDYAICRESKLAVGLIRGSTVEQLNTLLVQENTIRGYAGAQGFNLLQLFTDSGTSAEKVPFFSRPRALEALASMKEHNVFHLFVTKTDRAFRNHEDCIVTCRILWDDFGISVHFIDEGLISSRENDRMVLQIRASVAEEENRRRRDRQLGTLVVMRQNHERCGQYEPYGWRIDESRLRQTRRGTQSDYLLPEKTEQAGLRRIKSMIEEGMGTSAIARALNAEGVKPKGKPRWLRKLGFQPDSADGASSPSNQKPPRGVWYPSTVQSVLEHFKMDDGTQCLVENRAGRLHFQFTTPSLQHSITPVSVAA